MNLTQILKKHRIMVVVGCGGVGKTTLSSAVALKAALLGKKAIVCTIDPAKRLADVLGIDMNPNEICSVKLSDSLSFDAMMLDNKSTFDALIARVTKDPKKRQKMLNNRIYQSVSKTFARVTEYMAMEKLYELYESDQYDLIVLDTPPSKHTIDFLLKPNMVMRFVDNNFIGWVIKPYVWATKMGAGFVLNKAGKAFKAFSDFLGAGFMLELADLLVLFENLIVKFRKRADGIESLMRDEETSFAIVTGPSHLAMKESAFLASTFKEHRLNLTTCLVNKTMPKELVVKSRLLFKDKYKKEWFDKCSKGDTLQKLVRSYHFCSLRFDQEQKLIKQIKKQTAMVKIFKTVAHLPHGIQSLDDLHALSDAL